MRESIPRGQNLFIQQNKRNYLQYQRSGIESGLGFENTPNYPQDYRDYPQRSK